MWTVDHTNQRFFDSDFCHFPSPFICWSSWRQTENWGERRGTTCSKVPQIGEAEHCGKVATLSIISDKTVTKVWMNNGSNSGRTLALCFCWYKYFPLLLCFFTSLKSELLLPISGAPKNTQTDAKSASAAFWVKFQQSLHLFLTARQQHRETAGLSG